LMRRGEGRGNGRKRRVAEEREPFLLFVCLRNGERGDLTCGPLYLQRGKAERGAPHATPDAGWIEEQF
jgi:hypothetical protein